MKKVLASIVAASFLALGAGCYNNRQVQNPVAECPHCRYEECLEKYSNQIAGKDYQKGEIWVAFDNKLSLKKAAEFVERYDSRNELEVNGWVKIPEYENNLSVKVPEGKEIDYACYFDSIKDLSIISYAKPKPVITKE